MSRNPNSVGHWCHCKMYPQQCRDLGEFLSWKIGPPTGRMGPGLRECVTLCWILNHSPRVKLSTRSLRTLALVFWWKKDCLCGRWKSSAGGKWTHASGELTHLHVYPLTVFRKRNKNVWTAHRFIVLQDESPDESLTNMYINLDLTVMTKTTHMWKGGGGGGRPRLEKGSNPSEQLEQIPAEAPCLIYQKQLGSLDQTAAWLL